MLRLFLPILFPAWRFFNTIGPRPRVLVRFDDAPWQEFKPKPAQLGLWARVSHLLFNPQGNKTLFIQSCAVRLFEQVDTATVENIYLALAQAIAQGELIPPNAQAQILWCIEHISWDEQGRTEATVVYTAAARPVLQVQQQWQKDRALWF